MATKLTLIFLSCDYFPQTYQLARLPDFHSILYSNAQSHHFGTFQAENEKLITLQHPYFFYHVTIQSQGNTQALGWMMLSVH